MTATDVIQIIDYALKANTPLITIPVLFFIVCLLFAFTRRFFSTDYIAENKESREQLQQVINELRLEIERLNKRIEQLSKEKDQLTEKHDNVIGENEKT